MYDPKELAAARSDQERQMTDRCTIVYKSAGADDGQGGTIYGGETTQENIKCKVMPIRSIGQEVDEAGKRTSISPDSRVIMPWNTDCPTSATISVNTEVYEVINTNSGQTDALELQAFCIKRK